MPALYDDPTEIQRRAQQAVAHFWATRGSQAQGQAERGKNDQGRRGAATGGKQMDGFIDLLRDVILDCGIPAGCIHANSKLELPGFFRPTKRWDLLVVQDGQFICGLEVKSQVGSFGNNFNNRTEEAMGSALDLWTAFREGAITSSIRPWLGYLFLLEHCEASTSEVSVAEPHFPVLPEFRKTSYEKRYELFCRKLVREGHYTAATFLTAQEGARPKGAFHEPAADLTCVQYIRSLAAHVRAFAPPTGGISK